MTPGVQPRTCRDEQAGLWCLIKGAETPALGISAVAQLCIVAIRVRVTQRRTGVHADVPGLAVP